MRTAKAGPGRTTRSGAASRIASRIVSSGESDDEEETAAGGVDSAVLAAALTAQEEKAFKKGDKPAIANPAPQE